MNYNFVTNPPQITEDKLIATALNGEVYSENNRLHIKNTTWHLIYKYNGSPIGWYARNMKTSDDVYLGEGASPSIELESLAVKDEEFWLSILSIGIDPEFE